MTPLPQIISRNQSQKLSGIAINQRDTSGHPITYYTCPAGQKARCKGTIVCTGTGAAATVDLVVAGEIMFRWIVGGFVASYLDAPRTLGTTNDQAAQFDFFLAAGETVVSAQNTGSNAEVNMFMVVEESPA